MKRSNKQLIITADDFGLTPGVNKAISLACRDGIVTSASLMANGAAFQSAVEMARQETKLDLGLHLNLTEGRPVSDPARIPTIAGAGGFLYKHPSKLASAIFRGQVSAADLEMEIRAQIEKVLQPGLRVTHIDGHKHVHVVPAVIRIVSRIAPGYGIRAIRSTFEKVPSLGALLRKRESRRPILKQFVFGKALTAAWEFATPKDFALVSPQDFYGVTQTGFLDMDAFAGIIQRLEPGAHELMCHPGYVDDDLRNTPTRLLHQRERELELLTSPEARKLLEDHGVQLISYRELV